MPLPIEEPLLEFPEEFIEEPIVEAPEELTEPAPLEVPEFDPEEAEELPEVRHVFMIVLGENGFEESFGPSSAAPYLAKTLPEQGELLTNYYAVAKGKLANQAALLSGQGPTPQLVAECAPSEQVPVATDILPGTLSPEGQVEGDGCYYPAAVKTLPGQFAEKDLKYRTYVQEAVPGTPDPPSCASPYGLFHQLADTPECEESVAPISQLATDLKDPEKAPAFSYIVPNACHAGAVEPCEPRAADRPRGGGIVPPRSGAADRQVEGLRRRRPDPDHLGRGAADRPGAGLELLLRQPGLPEPAAAARRSAGRTGQEHRWRRPRRPPPALQIRQAGVGQRHHLRQPLHPAADARGTVRIRKTRLRQRTGAAALRLDRLQLRRRRIDLESEEEVPAEEAPATGTEAGKNSPKSGKRRP